MSIEMESMIDNFKDYFASKGYREAKPVKITSGVDPTVRFIGSHISTLKDVMLTGQIPEEGLFISQPCVRTRNKSRLFDDTYLPAWGSYFKSIGVVTNMDKAEELCSESLDYLVNVAGIPKEKLVLRVNSEDNDLYELAHRHGTELRFDDSTMPEKYYRHVLGVNGVRGRNFNYAIEEDGALYDVGNFIVIEKDGEAVGIELALGTSTIMKHKFALEHVTSASPVIIIEELSSPLKHKFADALITSSVLLDEGLRPSAAGNKEKILRSYMRAISYYKNSVGLGVSELSSAVRQSCADQGLNDSITAYITDFAKDDEVELTNASENELTAVCIAVKSRLISNT